MVSSEFLIGKNFKLMLQLCQIKIAEVTLQFINFLLQLTLATSFSRKMRNKKNRRMYLYQIVGEITLFTKFCLQGNSCLHPTQDSKSEKRKIAKINNNFQN